MKSLTKSLLSIFTAILLGGAILLTACVGQTVSEPPVVSDPQISAPTPQEPGQQIGIAVDVSSVSGVSLTYDWRADGGEIVRGQNSPAITYRTPDEPGIYNVRVTVKWDTSSVEKVTTIRVEAPEVAAVDEPALESEEDPLATIEADPSIYDNFDNSTFDETIDTGKWEIYSSERKLVCDALQIDGTLALNGHNIDQSGSCFLFGPSDVLGRQLETFEARIKMPSELDGFISTNLVIASDGFPGEVWMECGLEAYPIGVNAAFYEKTDGKVMEFQENISTEPNRWYMLKYEVNSDTMEVSCFLDDVLIGTTIPKDATIWKNSTVSRYIESHISSDVAATIFIDDVRIVP